MQDIQVGKGFGMFEATQAVIFLLLVGWLVGLFVCLFVCLFVRSFKLSNLIAVNFPGQRSLSFSKEYMAQLSNM